MTTIIRLQPIFFASNFDLKRKDISMPFVNIKITREGVTQEQKAQLIKGTTQLLVDILGKNPATTVVVIEEIETDNWGVGGESITKRRLAGK
jgi:4-oxalocrotonate tautomerase